MKDCRTLNILGTEYKVFLRKYDEDKSFKERNIFSYCDGYAKEIVMCNPGTYPGWEDEEEKTVLPYFRCMLRHEIIHAFLFESGLAQHSCESDSWATNEEMVDWFARQGPKICAAWKEVPAFSEVVKPKE